MTQLLPDGGLQLNLDVPHPPFAWQVSLPSDGSWSVLDTNPASWRAGAERLVDERLAGTRIKSAERREVLNLVGDLVASCQQAGTLISLVQIGGLTSGELSTAGLHIARYDSTPEPFDLGTVRRALSGRGVVVEHDTLAGKVLVQRDLQLASVPGRTNSVRVTSLQAFLLLMNRSFTAVVATATPHASLTDRLDEVAMTVVSSIEPLDTTGIVERNLDGSGPTGPHRVLPPGSPGGYRGCRTMTTHRIDPGSANTEPQP